MPHGILSFLALFLAALATSSAHAERVTRDVDIAGVTHVLSHEAGAPEGVVSTVLLAMRDSIPAYAALFHLPAVRVRIDIVDAPPHAARLADARPTDAPDQPRCTVRVFRTPANANLQALRFTVTHEVVHCFQFASRANPLLVVRAMAREPDVNSWWVEGSAEWLAATLQAPVGDPIERILREFYIITNQSLFTFGYEQYWFFVFLAHVRGSALIVDLVKHIPVTAPAQLAWIERKLGDTPSLFRTYGTLLMRTALPRQPPLTAAELPPYPVRAVPGDLFLSTPPLSAKLHLVTLPAPSPGSGIEVTMADGHGAGFRVVLASGQEVAAAPPVRLCGNDASQPLRLVVTRGKGADDAAAVKLHFAQVRCPRRPPTMASLVGTWNVVPATPSGAPPNNNVYTAIEQGATPNVLRIAEDGTITGELSGSQSFPDRYFSFRGASVQGTFRITGPARPDPKADFVIPIDLTSPLTGTSTGSGAVYLDAAASIIEPRPNLSGPMRFPTFTSIRCGNLRVTATHTFCDWLTLMEGQRERLDLFRAPASP